MGNQSSQSTCSSVWTRYDTSAVVSPPTRQQKYFCSLFWGIRCYCLRLFDPTPMPFVMSWVPWIPWHHLLPCPMILTVSFSFIKATSASLCSKHSKIKLLIDVILFSLLVFSCQLYQSLSLLFFPLTQIHVSCYLCIQSFPSSSISLLCVQVLKILSDHDPYQELPKR